MSFSIRHAEDNHLDTVIMRHESSGVEVAILPGYGMTLHAFCIPQEDGPALNMIDHYQGLEELEKELGKSFKGPKLSPFACRIAGSRYSFGGKEYSFRNSAGEGEAIHGLLYNKAFSIVEESADESSASLTAEYRYRAESPAYPHEYLCRVTYTLHPGNLLEVQTLVINEGRESLPLADGWHPYFRLGGKVDDWWLQFNEGSIVEFDESLIPTGRLLKYDAFHKGRLLGATQLDNCFVPESDGRTGPVCELYHPANGWRIRFSPDAAYPYLQLYIPPGRESIAIENLSGAPDCFNNKMGLLVLEPGNSQTFTARYQVSK